MMRTGCRTVVALLFLSPFGFLQAGESGETPQRVTFLPAGKIFPLFTADALSHQLSLSRVMDNHDYIGAVGGSVPMIQVDFPGVQTQASVAVTLFNRLVKTPGHLEVYTIDFKVDVPFDVRFSDFALRLAFGHISCHFADDALELFGKKSIQHVNDYMSLAAAYDIAVIGGYVYGGFNYSYGTQPVQHRPWLLQVGTHFGNIVIHEDIALYGALDVKIRQENGWGSTRSIQVGAQLFPYANRHIRFAYTRRTGFEDRGQFYLSTTSLNLISIFFDF